MMVNSLRVTIAEERISAESLNKLLIKICLMMKIQKKIVISALIKEVQVLTTMMSQVRMNRRAQMRT